MDSFPPPAHLEIAVLADLAISSLLAEAPMSSMLLGALPFVGQLVSAGQELSITPQAILSTLCIQL
jgi:hypothetical protein